MPMRTPLRRLAIAAATAAPGLFLAADALAGSALVNNLQATGQSGFGVTGEPQRLPVLVGNIIKNFMGLLGIVAVVLILYAGFLWMTAAGNEQKVEKARSILTQAVIGLAIVLAAYAITSFVVTSLINATTGR